ncbi:methyltransferase domain-containing protein [Candidatus Woesearchaeota archaeon]|nr:methyltransferase domain-containing protein [Candidatus Woesearchaeota archaeon]
MEFIQHDQHLLTNKEIAKQIAESIEIEGKTVLEIGCGKGILTKELAKKATVIGIEIDPKFKPDLESIKNLEIHFGNALEVIKGLEFDIIISNIPYAISEPLFYELLHKNFEKAILMVSTRFYNHLTSEEFKLGVLAKYLFGVKRLFDVGRNNFSPEPDTDSVVIELTKKGNTGLIQDFLLQYDKKVENAVREALANTLKITKNQARDKIASLHLKRFEKRVRQLKKEELQEIISALCSLS